MICDQASLPEVSVAQVARRYGVNANLIHKWLRDDRFAPDVSSQYEPESGEFADTVFLPVETAETGTAEPASLPQRYPAARSEPACSDAACGRIEIALPSGHRVMIEGAFDAGSVCALLGQLQQ